MTAIGQPFNVTIPWNQLRTIAVGDGVCSLMAMTGMPVGDRQVKQTDGPFYVESKTEAIYSVIDRRHPLSGSIND